MSASYNPTEVFKEAGVTVYDGDEIDPVSNMNFLEAGVATVYEIKRNGGREVTVEEESDLVLDASEIKDIKKQVDDIGKKLDYIMSEVSKTFKGYEDKYKEIFDKLKDAKSIIDKQLEQINTLEKEKVKVLKIEKREE